MQKMYLFQEFSIAVPSEIFHCESSSQYYPHYFLNQIELQEHVAFG